MPGTIIDAPDTETRDEQLRYGISALDLKYKDHAVKDELMVNSFDGKVFYKRESDGQIVTSDNLDYTKDELISAIHKTFLTSETMEITSDDYIVYNTINIAEKNNLLNSKPTELNISHKFSINKKDSGFFIRIRGNNSTNAIISKLMSEYRSNHEGDTIHPISITLNITEVGTSEPDITKVVNMEFDTLTFVRMNSSNMSCTGYKVSIVSMECPVISIAYSESSHKTDMTALNYGNRDTNGVTHFEAEIIDFIYYTDNLKDTSIYVEDDLIRLQYVLPVSDSEVNPFVISRIKPNHKCLWAKIIE